MSTGYFIEAREVTKRFGSVQALDCVSLGAREEELLVVVGPTGAGKTTLLRCLCGLEAPSSGSIGLEGRDVTRLGPAARDLAMVFQNFSLYPRFTVRENLAFPLRAPSRRVPEPEIKRRVEQAAELLHITRLLGRPALRLSGGEMQRVAIGRAIVREPRAFLMDEPLTNLDAKLRESLRVELVELRRRTGRPMIFVTHDQAEALSMADRVVVLDSGQVLQSGSPADVYERPRSPRVALQLGQPRINLFDVHLSEGAVRARDGSTLGSLPEGGAPWLVDLRTQSRGGRATLGVRPEDMALTGGQQPAEVSAIQYMGATTSLQLAWAGDRVNVALEGRPPHEVGDVVRPLVRRALMWDAP